MIVFARDSMPLLRAQLQSALGNAYTIERELGGGGMSRVFTAREHRLGRLVAIKVMTSASAADVSAERFEREIQVIASLQDPHIVPILTAGVADGLPYYTMPFVEGESLRQRLARVERDPIPVGDAVAILSDIAIALQCAHLHGIVHRDVKPENVLLAGRTAVVADFGIAKALSTAAMSVPSGNPMLLTMAGTALGTPGYMAPEQAAGGTVDPRTDIYAWGIIAYELLAGAHPFAARRNVQQLIAAHIAERPVNLGELKQELPIALTSLVMRTLEKDPDDRPESAGELVRALQDGLPNAVDGGSRPEQSRSAAHRPARWTTPRVVAAACAIAVIAAVGLGHTRIARALHLANSGVDSSASTVAPAAHSAATLRTVAVLPFVNLGGNAQDEYFSDGMTDELTNSLSTLPSLRVAARSSGFAFKGKPTSVQEIGRKLNVAAVVEGTIRRAGNRLRVTAELIRTADATVVWSNTYESDAKNVFDVQDTFTKAIVGALTPALSSEARKAATNSRGTTNSNAYDLYLKGRYFWNQRTEEGLTKGATFFEKAIAADSNFARAYAGLADSYSVLTAFGFVEPRIAYGKAKTAVLHAVRLDSTLAEAHASLGFIHLYYDLDLPAADSELTKAIALDPGYATAHLYRAWYLLAARRTSDAVHEASVARALEPLSLIINTRLATMLLYDHQYEAAQRQLKKTLELDPDFGVAHDQVAYTLAAEGDYAGSINSARTSLADGYVQANAILGFALAKSGQRAAANALLDSLAAGDGAHYVRPFDIALTYAGLGDDAQAIQWFGRAIDTRDPEALHLSVDPLLERLHRDPRFVEVIARTR